MSKKEIINTPDTTTPVKRKRGSGAGGRPNKISGPESIFLKKLEEAFELDCSISEACFHAGISVPTYYSFIEKNPGYKERFEALRNNPYVIARKTMIEGLKNDHAFALKYMERKKKEEFSTLQEIKHDGDLVGNILGSYDIVIEQNDTESNKLGEDKND